MVSSQNVEKLSKCGWTRSARTDKGVSAARHIVSVKLELPADATTESAVERLNACLPEDIRVFDAVRVTKSFEAKNSCDRRRYTYVLPEFLLMSPSDALEIFRKHLDDIDMESLREVICASKKRGDKHTPSLWRISDDEKKRALAADFARYRADPAILEALSAFLRSYGGTRNFHNFTAKRKADDESCKRYIISFDVEGDPITFPEASARWLRLTVVGQSFMLHQIRKMVAVASEAVRTHRVTDAATSNTIIDGLCDKTKDVPLQLVPGDGLYLGEPIFHSYNEYKADPENARPKLIWDHDHPKFHTIEAFRRDVVEKAIFQDGSPDALLPFIDYLWQVSVFGFQLSPDDPIPPCNLDGTDLRRLDDDAPSVSSET